MTSLQALIRLSLLTITGCVALASLAHSAQPTDVVVSDSFENTAMGTGALLNLGSGFWNTAAGFDALTSNGGGIGNTAVGVSALFTNSDGNYNTAIGTIALAFSDTGSNNTATGYEALYTNVAGSNNTASGYRALIENQTGQNNTGVGSGALSNNRTGSNNIALGGNAGFYVRGGNYNIEIGNVGTANDVGTIRVGTANQQSTTYVAGISGAHITGSAVYVSPTGQLGVLASSERYKTDVASMGSSSEKVKELRPVTFHLKTDPKAGVQYGLIAEEVAKVYPELVIRGDKGQIEGVRYEELTPMLLNEIQRQQGTIAAQGKQLHDMQQQLAELQGFRRSMQGRAPNQ